MKEGDLVEKCLGDKEVGTIGIIVKICQYTQITPIKSDRFEYAVVNTSIGLRRWYCTRLKKI